MWFERLGTNRSTYLVDGPNYDVPPVISVAAGEIPDSLGPYGKIFVSVVIDDNDKIICKRLLKGDSALLPKFENLLKKQVVQSAKHHGGRKVYSTFSIWLQFVPYPEKINKGKR